MRLLRYSIAIIPTWKVYVRIRYFLLLAVLLIPAGSLRAESDRNAASAVVEQAEPSQGMAMIKDEELKAFRFVIDGKEVARIDAAGVTVLKDMTYGGVVTDAGSASIEKKLKATALPKGDGDAR